MSQQSYIDILLARVRDQFQIMVSILAFLIVAFLLMLISLIAGNLGPETYVITILNLIGIGFFLLLFGALLLGARYRERKTRADDDTT